MCHWGIRSDDPGILSLKGKGLNMEKAPLAMIAAVRRVCLAERTQAIHLAEKVYHQHLTKLELFGDYGTDTNKEMAAQAAAAEVLFRFA